MWITAGAQTHINGDISGNKFNDSSATYIIEGDIVVPKGTHVTIGAGSVLMFKQYTGLIVQGRLTVAGTRENPVVFTSLNDTRHNPEAEQLPNDFDWNGITVAHKAGLITIGNAVIAYSVFGVKSQTQGIILEDCVFHDNGQFHFTVNDQIIALNPNIRMSYRPENAPADKAGMGSRQKNSSGVSRQDDPDKNRRIRKGIGIGTIVAAVACGATCAVFGTMVDTDRKAARSAAENIDHMIVRNSSNPAYVVESDKLDNANMAQRQHRGAAIGFGIGAGLLLGVGIVLEF